MRRLRTYSAEKKLRPLSRPAQVTTLVLDTDQFLAAMRGQQRQPELADKPSALEEHPAWWGPRTMPRH
jgi:hypothetical protein